MRPGGSWLGGVPTAMHQQLQREHLDLARKSLTKAKKDHDAIRKDYEAQFTAFRDSHHREPTDAELAEAHFERHRTAEDDDYLNDLDNKWQEHLRTERTEGEQDEDDEDENTDEDFFTERFDSSQLSQMYGPVRGGLGYYESSPPTSAGPDSQEVLSSSNKGASQ